MGGAGLVRREYGFSASVDSGHSLTLDLLHSIALLSVLSLLGEVRICMYCFLLKVNAIELTGVFLKFNAREDSAVKHDFV